MGGGSIQGLHGALWAPERSLLVGELFDPSLRKRGRRGGSNTYPQQGKELNNLREGLGTRPCPRRHSRDAAFSAEPFLFQEQDCQWRLPERPPGAQPQPHRAGRGPHHEPARQPPVHVPPQPQHGAAPRTDQEQHGCQQAGGHLAHADPGGAAAGILSRRVRGLGPAGWGKSAAQRPWGGGERRWVSLSSALALRVGREPQQRQREGCFYQIPARSQCLPRPAGPHLVGLTAVDEVLNVCEVWCLC